jgi:hypothetical protein
MAGALDQACGLLSVGSVPHARPSRGRGGAAAWAQSGGRPPLAAQLATRALVDCILDAALDVVGAEEVWICESMTAMLRRKRPSR